MSENDEAQWTPSSVRPGWTDAEPANQTELLHAEAAKLRNDYETLRAKFQILHDIAVEFVKEADARDLGDDPGPAIADTREELDPLRNLQIWIYQWKEAIVAFVKVPSNHQEVSKGGADSVAQSDVGRGRSADNARY
ncbi:hypothetical protein yc1106_02756 [Curvularia clavata]|uniref:Uncharacterized protein n=1 Tax=Curvularia clavata TaxID=95742 RepID=A0A9Q8Z4C8_CURCL|nr:hypothetical protein yc1106_02756 [Curvularia clavata]